MALFGFLNFNKEGPGIEKDAPKKRTFIVFLETYFMAVHRLKAIF